MASNRRFKFDRGDWVLPRSRYASLGALARPGRVVEADADGVVVRFPQGDEQFTGEQVAGLMRVRWSRQGGRSRWRPA